MLEKNSPSVLAAAFEALGLLSLELDLETNDQSPADTDIATYDSTMQVLIAHTQGD